MAVVVRLEPMHHIQDSRIDIPLSTPADIPLPVHDHHRGIRLKTFGAASLLAVGSVLLGDSSYVTLQDYKPSGPYYASDTSRDTPLPDPVEIPAQPADALRLSDDWGGIIATTGFSITYDEPVIAESLGPRDIAIITQTDTTFGDNAVPEDITEAVRIIPTDTSQLYDGRLSTEQSDILSLRSFATPWDTDYLGGNDDFKDYTEDPHTKQLGNGVSSHGDSETELTYTRYRFNRDGTTTITEQRFAAATNSANANCNDVPNTITSEVVLTADQYALICQIFAKYSGVIPSDYSVELNSTTLPYQANDSVNWGSRSIELTYPYDSGVQVPAEDVSRVALHEFLHTTYRDLGEDSAELRAITTAYQAMVDAMHYQMPDWRTSFISDTPTEAVEPVWGAITEWTYLKPGSRDGHPSDNPTEMLSSTGTVMTYFPEPFINKFASLQKYEQRAILQSAEAVGSMIATRTAPGNIIPDYDALTQKMHAIVNS